MLDYEELLAFASKKKRARGHGQDAKGGGGILSKLKKKVRRKRMSTPRARSNPPPLPVMQCLGSTVIIDVSRADYGTIFQG